jgi:type II secretory pathway component PulL
MEHYEAIYRLEAIQEQLNELGNEAAEIFREHFPRQYQTGDAYGAFSFGSSWNSYNTTLETLIESARNSEEEYA